MIRSVQKFKSVFHPGSSPEDNPGRAYYGLVNEGLLAAQYRSTLAEASEEAVFIAPVVTYLAMNRRSQIQFWLDIGNPAWAERLYQPLTHPYVLSRSWERGSKWSDEDEQAVRRQILMTMTVGLTRRCGKRVYLCQNTYGDQGLEQQGVLLNALQSLLSEDFRNQGR